MPREILGFVLKWLHVLSGSVPSRAQPADPASPLTTEDDNSEEQDRELSQLHAQDSREAENSAELWPRDDEEESRDNDEYVTDDVSPQSVIADIDTGFCQTVGFCLILWEGI